MLNEKLIGREELSYTRSTPGIKQVDLYQDYSWYKMTCWSMLNKKLIGREELFYTRNNLGIKQSFYTKIIPGII